MKSVYEIKKRNGEIVPIVSDKIKYAISKAFKATNEIQAYRFEEICDNLTIEVMNTVYEKYDNPVYIEDIQDEIEKILMISYSQTAKAYILYRKEREHERDKNSRLMKTLNTIAQNDAKDINIKRENANINADTSMGTMLKFGSESAKLYYMTHILSDEYQKAHENGDIHIHDLDFYNLTATCCQINLTELFKEGFNTGNGSVREPRNISSYASLTAIAIQANQNDMHGGQSIPNFDRDMAPGVVKTFIKFFIKNLSNILADHLRLDDKKAFDLVEYAINKMKEDLSLVNSIEYDMSLSVQLSVSIDLVIKARKRATEETDEATFKAMEALIHNLNTMHSRAGAQVPFSSLNYGTDTSPEGRMVIKNILQATISGLGDGETPIFPIQIFRLKKGINMDPIDSNYDLFQLALECSAHRMFPNFSFQDAPFNLQYYDKNKPETEIAYMGCRTRVMGNVYDKEKEISYSRGNLSFTTINLPRLAFKNRHNVTKFTTELNNMMELVSNQLLERLEILSNKKVYNFPFLMGQGLWLGSKELNNNDTIGEILKHGSLSIGFIGLAETLILLKGQHHGECTISQEYGLDIIGIMRDFCDKKSSETGLNFTLLSTPAEGLSGRFIEMDKKLFGIVEGVTDKEYYTNGFHIPVSYSTSIFHKIKTEAPYHTLTNAGHISYVEVDGNLRNNIQAFESIIKYMGECGMGYGAVNHPLDRDPICGYNGIIEDKCPKCGRTEEDGVKFEHIRRITGYLSGTVDRFNNAKRAEERDRVKHNM